MPDQISLYSGPLSMFGAKAQIALHEKGLSFHLTMVPFEMARLYEPKHPEVLRINPKRQVPVLIHGGLEIFDSTQIFEYVEDLAPQPPLWPAGRQERARARLAELQSDEVYFPHIIRLMGLQDRTEDPLAVAARAGAAEFYARMEAQIAKSEYLSGEYGYADIAFFMAQFFGDRMGAPIAAEFPRLTKWRNRVASRPAVSAVLKPMASFLKSQGRAVPSWVGV